MNVRDAFTDEITDFIADAGWADLPLTDRATALEKAARRLRMDAAANLPPVMVGDGPGQRQRTANGFPGYPPFAVWPPYGNA